MNNWIGPTVKHVWNDAMLVLHSFLWCDINTTAFRLGLHSLHLNSSMGKPFVHLLLLKSFTCGPIEFVNGRKIDRSKFCLLGSSKFWTPKEVGKAEDWTPNSTPSRIGTRQKKVLKIFSKMKAKFNFVTEFKNNHFFCVAIRLRVRF